MTSDKRKSESLLSIFDDLKQELALNLSGKPLRDGKQAVERLKPAVELELRPLPTEGAEKPTEQETRKDYGAG